MDNVKSSIPIPPPLPPLPPYTPKPDNRKGDFSHNKEIKMDKEVPKEKKEKDEKGKKEEEAEKGKKEEEEEVNKEASVIPNNEKDKKEKIDIKGWINDNIDDNIIAKCLFSIQVFIESILNSPYEAIYDLVQYLVIKGLTFRLLRLWLIFIGIIILILVIAYLFLDILLTPWLLGIVFSSLILLLIPKLGIMHTKSLNDFLNCKDKIELQINKFKPTRVAKESKPNEEVSEYNCYSDDDEF